MIKVKPKIKKPAPEVTSNTILLQHGPRVAITKDKTGFRATVDGTRFCAETEEGLRAAISTLFVILDENHEDLLLAGSTVGLGSCPRSYWYPKFLSKHARTN